MKFITFIRKFFDGPLILINIIAQTDANLVQPQKEPTQMMATATGPNPPKYLSSCIDGANNVSEELDMIEQINEMAGDYMADKLEPMDEL